MVKPGLEDVLNDDATLFWKVFHLCHFSRSSYFYFGIRCNTSSEKCLAGNENLPVLIPDILHWYLEHMALSNDVFLVLTRVE
jgi:hypothetical protein